MSRTCLPVLTLALACAGCQCGGGQPASTVLVVNTAGGRCPSSLAVQSGELYWADICTREIGHLALDGGSPATLAAEAIASGMRVDATRIYWFERPGKLVAIALDGGLPVDLVLGLEGPHGLAINTTTAFFSTLGPDAGTWSVPLLGGSPTRLSATTHAQLVASERDVYWAEGGSVVRRSLDTGAEQIIASNQNRIGPLALTASAIFWGTGSVEETFQGQPPAGSLMTAPLDGGAARVLAMTENPTSIAVDGTSVVWTTSPVQISPGLFGAGATLTKGSLSQTDLAGTSVVTLDDPNAGRDPSYARIAIDPSAVYWVTEGNEIIRTSR